MGLILVAVGGNALIRTGQIGSAAEQLENARLTARDLLRLLEEGQFPPGSMGPKVESAAEFVERTGREAVITDLASLVGAAGGSAGTRVAAA